MGISAGLLLVLMTSFGQVVAPAVPAMQAGQVAIAATTLASDQPDATSDDSFTFGIRLRNGDYASGELVETPDAKEWIGWKSPAFQNPISFATDSIESITFEQKTDADSPGENYRVSLIDGASLTGELVEITDDSLSIKAPDMGKLTIHRDRLNRLLRIDKSHQLLFDGLDSGQWNPNTQWTDEGAKLISRIPSSLLSVKKSFPDQLLVELELSWEKECNFELGIAAADPSFAAFAKLEVWSDQLVIVSERERNAELQAIQKVDSSRAGQLAIQICVDRKKGKVIVIPSNGEKPITLDVSDKSFVLNGDGFYLLNKKGTLQLDRFSVSTWNGDAPVSVDGSKSRILSADGKIFYGNVKAFTPANQQLTIDVDKTDESISINEFREVIFNNKTTASAGPWFISTTTGITVIGMVERIEQSKMWIKSEGIQELIGIPLDHLIHLRHPSTKRAAKNPNPSEAQFVAHQTSLRGVLADGELKDPASLLFKPLSAKDAAPISTAASARIVYLSESPLPSTSASATNVMEIRQGNGVVIRRMTNTNTPITRMKSPSRAKETPHVLHLMSGDLVPCRIDAIDEKGIHLSTPIIKAKFIPHDQVRAVELMPDVAAIGLGKFKRERLLTVPRIQRDSPPTHLIRSMNGDYLRCRLLLMNDQSLEVEIRLEKRSIPRSGVARILWLASNTETASTPGKPETPGSYFVQAVYSNGNRLTFQPTKVEGMKLFGESKLIGACEVNLKDLNALLVGPGIHQATTALSFQQWKLKAAPDPLPSESSEGDGSSGQESALVGKPAPGFELDHVDGGKFRLADAKGSIVVLDFWASWCGPCLQTMPQVVKVAREFADKKVILIGVNLEESAAKVKAALDRLGLDLKVVLDSDGDTAEKYGATAIPQTVIIDQTGNVSHVFVGANPRFDDVLREAIQKLIEKDAKP
ncbi:TlpA family protein disulfide reductase [bacterium]|nr:TlpA family protein disulfide reductase [bacterium]